MGNNEYDENFFKQLDIIENNVLDGLSFDEVVKDKNLKVITISKVNANKEDENRNKINDLSNEFFKSIYNITSPKLPKIINVQNKYYLAELLKFDKSIKPFNDPDVQKALNAQLNFKKKIENNTSIIKDISMGGLDKNKFKKFASDNSLEVRDYKIKNLKQNDVFSQSIIKRIFLTKDGQIDLITDNTLTKNFLVLAIKTEYEKIDKESNKYEQYEAKARLNLINMIYKSHDNFLNNKYKVELNQRTIERVKNSF